MNLINPPETDLLVQLTSQAPNNQFVQDMIDALADNTKIAYKKALKRFLASGFAFPATPTEVANYIRNLPLSLNTIGIHLAALSFVHRAMRFPDPTVDMEVKMAMKALRNLVGEDVTKRAKPLLKADILLILAELDYQLLIDLRDATMLLIGFTGGFRRSELCGLRLEDIEFHQDGLLLNVRRSKRKNVNFKKAISYARGQVCPVKTLKKWIQQAKITEGFLFRAMKNGQTRKNALNGQSLSDRLKLLCERAGVPTVYQPSPKDIKLEISGHSLRAGFITECRNRDIADWKIAKVTGHKDLRNLEVYTREIDLFKDGAILW